MPNYRSNTSTTDPRAAAAPNTLPPSNAATLRGMFEDGMQRLQNFAPTGAEQARGKERLLNVGAQIDLNIEAAESNPFALQGLAQEVMQWRRSIFGLTGNYGTINGQALSGVGTLGTTWEHTGISNKWIWGLLGAGAIAVGVGFWFMLRGKHSGGMGGGLGAVHETKLKLHQTRIPNAKPSK